MVLHPEEEELSAWMDGEVAAETAEILRLHVGQCAVCQTRVELLAEVSTLLAPLRTVRPPASLRHRFQAEWSERWGRLRVHRSLGSLVLGWSPALAAAAVAVVLMPSLRGPTSRLNPAEPGPQLAFKPIPDPAVTWGEMPHGVLVPPKRSMALAKPSSMKAPHLSGRADSSVERPTLAHGDTTEAALERSPSPRIAAAPSEHASPVISQAPAERDPDGPAVSKTKLPEIPEAEAGRAEGDRQFEIEVEDAVASGPVRHSACAWSTLDLDTGQMTAASVEQNFGDDGRLQSVQVDLPLGTGTSMDAPKEGETHEQSMETRPADPRDLLVVGDDSPRLDI